MNGKVSCTISPILSFACKNRIAVLRAEQHNVHNEERNTVITGRISFRVSSYFVSARSICIPSSCSVSFTLTIRLHLNIHTTPIYFTVHVKHGSHFRLALVNFPQRERAT